MKFLAKTVETYRVDTEHECEVIITEAKDDSRFTLAKYNCEQKDVKAKGEIIDSYFVVTLTKVFNDIKDPANHVEVTYEVD